ncbi:MAG: multiple antibiotic resistance protein MarC [Ferroplasma sp. Type II]|jgi:multiple antibiotic resistance protein|uniref:MarC family protein n=1 Tax=Ferroplasma sp. Type II TaxID=261388 RepID=UPI0003896B7A|nr:MarC family protein [Ferroplasma sp. Type II]EQB74246.1 MAG: multiple antibiotic resistance protein MarC [Ferroplasma sp. Type II]HIH59821.1 MarC family protein [Ferroplasma sp.]
MTFIADFLKVFMPLLVVIDPFGSLAIFVGMAGSFNRDTRRTISKDAVLYAGIIIILFALAGGIIIQFFGISIEALEIAGGIILLLMGIEMVRQGAKPDTSVESSKNMGIVPFATPLLAGPGAISLVIILMKGDLMTKMLTIVSVLLVLAIVYFFFIYSSKILSVLGDKIMTAITRIFGLLVAGFAIQYFLDALIALSVIK